jgi:hypothetical protein
MGDREPVAAGRVADEALRPPWEIADPLDRYRRAREQELMHRQAAKRLVELRAMAALELHEGGASYARIAHGIGLTRARAQQLVQRGRKLREDADGLTERRRAASQQALILGERWRQVGERAEELIRHDREIRSESGGEGSSRA